MGIPGSANPLLLSSAAVAGGYSISRSVRFNSADSAYLNRTPASAGNLTTWTWAGWVKKTLITTSTDYRGIFTARSASNNYAYLDFSDNGIRFANRPPSGTIAVLQTTPVFRDPSAWFHLVFVFDSANATSTDTLRLYINGTRVTTFSSATYPSASQASIINSAVSHYIGYDSQNTAYLDGYLADVHLVDGQALDPTSFGEFDDNGIWQPIEYTGSFGTNGFHLDFADNSTAAALGTDTSGNGNDWTVNNISVTPGSGNDSLVDVPTNGTQTDTGVGGEVRGNYCTWNPLDFQTVVPSNGNLDTYRLGTAWQTGRATIGLSSGKWYWEITAGTGISTVNGPYNVVQVGLSKLGVTGELQLSSSGWAYYNLNGNKGNGSSVSYGASWTSGDIIGVAFDADGGSLTFYKNGVSQGVAFTGLTSGPYFPAIAQYSQNGSTCHVNFGQRPFTYTAPSGFKALNTANLPAPTIEDGSAYMDVVTYQGASVQQSITSLNFSPDLVWIKNRTAGGANGYNYLVDAVRGIDTTDNYLTTNTTGEEEAYLPNLRVSSLDSNGFTLEGSYTFTNNSSYNYVAWTWDAGSSTVTLNPGDPGAGSITSTVRANPSAGFSIVTYTGTNANATVGHGLGVAPSLLIIKNRNTARNWPVWFQGFSGTEYLYLNSDGAKSTTSTFWNNTTPTSTVFSLGTGSTPNTSGDSHVAYCFAPVAGYSAMGSYVGNGSSDGSFVFCNFRPRWVLIKRTDSTGIWLIYDSARSSYNEANVLLQPHSSAAELNYPTDPNIRIDILSNGFKLRNASGSQNASGATYIYYAVAENPFALNARAR